MGIKELAQIALKKNKKRVTITISEDAFEKMMEMVDAFDGATKNDIVEAAIDDAYKTFIGLKKKNEKNKNKNGE